jgi:hypothetical protein
MWPNTNHMFVYFLLFWKRKESYCCLCALFEEIYQIILQLWYAQVLTSDYLDVCIPSNFSFSAQFVSYEREIVDYFFPELHFWHLTSKTQGLLRIRIDDQRVTTRNIHCRAKVPFNHPDSVHQFPLGFVEGQKHFSPPPFMTLCQPSRDLTLLDSARYSVRLITAPSPTHRQLSGIYTCSSDHQPHLPVWRRVRIPPP